MENDDILIVKCPKCKNEQRTKKPPILAVYKFKCKSCGTVFNVPYGVKMPKTKEEKEELDKFVEQQKKELAERKAAEKAQQPDPTEVYDPTVVVGGTVVGGTVGGFSGGLEIPMVLVQRRRYLPDKDIPLKPGVTTIGRKDNDKPSDIMVDGDKFMSRRSVQITVEMTKSGRCQHLLKVLSAANPVLVNKKVQEVGTEVFLRNGDELKLGNTLFKLKKITTKKK